MFNIHEVAQNYDEVEVVDRNTLTGFTRSGWVLLVILQEPTSVIKSGETWYEGGDEKRHYYQPELNCDTLFVVGRKLAERKKAETLETAQAGNVDREKRIHELQKDLAGVVEKLGLRDKLIDDTNEEKHKLGMDIVRARDAETKMEKDIAKVRAAVGADRMAEILGRDNES